MQIMELTNLIEASKYLHNQYEKLIEDAKEALDNIGNNTIPENQHYFFTILIILRAIFIFCVYEFLFKIV